MQVLKKYTKRLAPIGVAFALVTAMTAPASAATLTSITVTPSNPTADANGVTYTVSASNWTVTAVQCLRLTVDTAADFSSGSLPAGFSVSGNPGAGSLVTAGTWTGGPTTATNTVSWTSTGGMTFDTGTKNFTFTADNPTAAATIYIRVATFTNTGCTTGGDSGSGAAVITDNTVVSVIVDPSLTFTVANKNSSCNGETGTYVDNSGGSATSLSLGRMSAGQTKASAQTLTLATNAAAGFTVTMRGTQATQNLRNGSHNWVDVAGSYASPAAFGANERFGYTMADATSGSAISFTSNNFAALTSTDRQVMSGGAAVQAGSSCVSFQAAADSTTPAGTYTATVIYTAVPTF